MFRIGDTVLYGTTGVCYVEDKIEKEIAHVKKEYYVLRPVTHGNSSVFVPADNPTLLGKVKPLLSKEEILALIRSLPAQAPGWIEGNGERREVFGQILQNGDRKELMQLIRTVYLRQQELAAEGKRLHLVDERVFKEAQRLLYEEFAVVLGIEQDQVVPFIVEQIEG